MVRVVVLTGERGIGKTTICRDTVALARARGYECAGILTLARDGVRDVYDVRSGEAHRLTRGADGESIVVQGRFGFSAKTLSWGRDVLVRSVPCDLLVVDEIGPLEIERDEGWVVAFDVLQGGSFTLAIAVVRPELVARARGRLSGPDTAIVTATRENRDRLPAVLMEMLRKEDA
jgi:nucleoside-triphosphatase THEP1